MKKISYWYPFTIAFNIVGKVSKILLSPPVLSGYNGSTDNRFSRGTTRLMSWPDGERYLCPLQSLAVLSSYLSYPLLSFLGLEAYCLIKILRHTRSPRFPPRNLYSIVTLAVFSLVYATTDTVFC